MRQYLTAADTRPSPGVAQRHRNQKEEWMLLATTTFEDFDRFESVFSTKGAEKRKQHGCKGAQVFRDPNQDERVWVIFDWAAAGWRQSATDPEVPPIMQEAGHKGRPQVAELGGRYDACPRQGRSDRRPNGADLVHGHRERECGPHGHRRRHRKGWPAWAAGRPPSRGRR